MKSRRIFRFISLAHGSTRRLVSLARGPTRFDFSLCVVLVSSVQLARPPGTAAEPPPSIIDLHPATAAAALLDAEGGVGVEGHLHSPTAPARASAEVAMPEAEAASDLALELPGLERMANGSYRFRSPNFTATITRDGQVSFRDFFFGFQRRLKPLAQPNKDLPKQPEGATLPVSPPWLALQLRSDLLGRLESRLGNQPYKAEKTWFLTQSRGLREHLQAEASRDSLRSALLSIWSRVGLKFEERRTLTFELWKHTARDEYGERSRQVITAFVRERCPATSACAYSSPELTKLNREQSQDRIFAPYVEARRTSREQNTDKNPRVHEHEPAPTSPLSAPGSERAARESSKRLPRRRGRPGMGSRPSHTHGGPAGSVRAQLAERRSLLFQGRTAHGTRRLDRGLAYDAED